jgi:type II secretory pathway pseudopilin PulG
MQENARTQQMASQQMMQLQQSQMQAMQSQQVQPLQLFQMMKEASSGTDSVLKSAVGVYNDLFGTARTMFSEMARMAGGEPEHPAIRIAEGIGGSLSKMADRYLSGQASKDIAESKAKQEQAKAYAQYVAAAQQQQQASQGIPQPPSSAQPIAELNGAQAPAAAATPTPTGPKLRVENGGAGAPVAASKPDESPGAKVIPLRRFGKTDAEWFGPALTDVEKLRGAVNDFINGLRDGKTDGLQPDQAVQFIVMGINTALGRNIDIKAFSLLFQEERYADFLDVLLPDAPQSYRDDCVKGLIEIVSDSDEEDEEDGEENVDGDDSDDQDAGAS